MNSLREKKHFLCKSETKPDRMQTRSFFQTREISLRHLKGRKTTEKSKLPHPHPIYYLEVDYLQ